MQKKPSEKLDSHEHIPLSSENVETESKVEHVVRDIQEQVTDTLYPTGSDTKKGNSDEMVEYEKGLSQNSLNKKILREYEKDQYRNVLLQNMDKLMDIELWFNEDDGKYYFHNVVGTAKWPKIEGKRLNTFPSSALLRELGIIGQDAESMEGRNQVEKLFAVFFGPEKIATEEDYKNLFASQLEEIIPELEKVGLELINGKYYFHNFAGNAQWPKIEGKGLRHFPNVEFLREYGIIDQNASCMTSGSQLAKLMEVLLGVEIATEEDYKKLFASQLKEVIPELEKIGLQVTGGKYYFNNLQ